MRHKLLEWWIRIPRNVRVGCLFVLTVFVLAAAFLKGWQTILHMDTVDGKRVVISLVAAIAIAAVFRANKKG
jgi:general stress protein CsbA